jgi:hypothetical protein
LFGLQQQNLLRQQYVLQVHACSWECSVLVLLVWWWGVLTVVAVNAFHVGTRGEVDEQQKNDSEPGEPGM